MKVLLSLACAGLAVAAAPASAADLLGTSPPLTMPGSQAPTMFEVGTNWYVRGDLGISFDKAPSVSFSSIALPPLGVVGAPLTIGNGANWTTRTSPAASGSAIGGTTGCGSTPPGTTAPAREERVRRPSSAPMASHPTPHRLSLRHHQHLQRIGEPASIRQRVPRQRLCRSWDLLRLHPLCRRRPRPQHEHPVGKRRLQRDRQRPAYAANLTATGAIRRSGSIRRARH